MPTLWHSITATTFPYRRMRSELGTVKRERSG